MLDGQRIKSITLWRNCVQIFLSLGPHDVGQSAVVARCDVFRLASSLVSFKKSVTSAGGLSLFSGRLGQSLNEDKEKAMNL